MKQWLNIFVLAFLAISPGMNTDALAHSLLLCRLTPVSVSAQASSSIPDHHHKQKNTDDDHGDDCQHLASMTAQPLAVPGIQLPGSQHAPLPSLSTLTLSARSLPRVAPPSLVDNRPPPLSILYGTTLLLI